MSESDYNKGIEAAACLAEDVAKQWADPYMNKINPMAIIRKEEAQHLATLIRGLKVAEHGESAVMTDKPG